MHLFWILMWNINFSVNIQLTHILTVRPSFPQPCWNVFFIVTWLSQMRRWASELQFCCFSWFVIAYSHFLLFVKVLESLQILCHVSFDIVVFKRNLRFTNKCIKYHIWFIFEYPQPHNFYNLIIFYQKSYMYRSMSS